MPVFKEPDEFSSSTKLFLISPTSFVSLFRICLALIMNRTIKYLSPHSPVGRCTVIQVYIRHLLNFILLEDNSHALVCPLQYSA